MTENALLELEDVLAGAARLVWTVRVTGNRATLWAGEAQIATVRVGRGDQGLRNAAFMALAHERMPALLAEVRGQAAEIRRLRAMLQALGYALEAHAAGKMLKSE